MHLSKQHKVPPSSTKIGFAIAGIIISGTVLFLGILLIIGAVAG
ncbi:MAG: hypothetical protein ACRBFS_12415 [Aureispira sp.]